jgi:hypothetical protein
MVLGGIACHGDIVFRLSQGNPCDGPLANGIDALYSQLEWRMWDHRDHRMSL